MGVESSSLGIIKDSLVGELKTKDWSKDESGFPGTYSKRDIEGEDKAENIGGVIDFCKIYFRLSWRGVYKLMRLKVILSVLIAEFKLWAAGFSKETFSWVKLTEILDTMRAVIITTLIDGNLFAVFPGKEGLMAIGAVVFSFFLERIVGRVERGDYRVCT